MSSTSLVYLHMLRADTVIRARTPYASPASALYSCTSLSMATGQLLSTSVSSSKVFLWLVISSYKLACSHMHTCDGHIGQDNTTITRLWLQRRNQGEIWSPANPLLRHNLLHVDVALHERGFIIPEMPGHSHPYCASVAQKRSLSLKLPAKVPKYTGLRYQKNTGHFLHD